MANKIVFVTWDLGRVINDVWFLCHLLGSFAGETMSNIQKWNGPVFTPKILFYLNKPNLCISKYQAKLQWNEPSLTMFSHQFVHLSINERRRERKITKWQSAKGNRVRGSKRKMETVRPKIRRKLFLSLFLSLSILQSKKYCRKW